MHARILSLLLVISFSSSNLLTLHVVKPLSIYLVGTHALFPAEDGHGDFETESRLKS